MDFYAIVISPEQKEIIEKALSAYTSMALGQNVYEREAAKKLLPLVRKMHHNGTNDLTK